VAYNFSNSLEIGALPKTPSDPTDSLGGLIEGNPKAAADLLPQIYGELKALAAGYMRNERRDHTLQPTALVHEAYMRLINIKKVDWKNKAHFLAMAARQMRRVLVEHARSHGAQKRGADRHRVTLDEHVALTSDRTIDVLAVDEALKQLAALDSRHGQVVELRFFAGLNVKQTAYVLGVSERTVKNDWRMARAWLLDALGH
jgi:RNA polymerase sigma factor (TIGR02999 family)